MAVILSGDGNDGATGAVAVHQFGGTVLAADEVPDAGSAPPDPLAVHAAARLNRWWPTLGGAEARSAS